MDSRFKLREIRGFFKNLRKDYKNSTEPDKRAKRKSFSRTIKLLMVQIWCGITAPIFYPIWYLFRTPITNKMYKGTSWQFIHKLVEDNKIQEAKNILKKNGGRFLYWLWTFGDLRDPLGRGELADNVKDNNFRTRYYENAIRNPRFTINYMEFRSGTILKSITVIDTRDFGNQHSSEGIGNVPDGVYFKWMLDDRGSWIFIYEDNNKDSLFYYGYTGLLKDDIGHNGRFELGYRPN